MNTLRPFFLLLGRASVFWMGAIGLIVVGMVVAGISDPEERLGLILDAAFVAAFAFPAGAGWLAGAVVQEFQHTSFATHLPGVRFRIATGFVATGLVVSLVVVGLIGRMSTTPQNLAALLAVGLGAYCLGGVLVDPLSTWISGFNVVIVLLLVARSRDVARIVDNYPWPVVAIALAVGVVCFLRLFARSTFRLKPFHPTSFLPGRFSLEKARRIEQWKRARRGPTKTGWHAGYLGSNPWSWVRAAFHEVHGDRGWRNSSKALNPLACLGFLVVLNAWLDRGEFSFGGAVARSIYDALFRSPHQPQFGEHGGPFLMVLIVIAAAGVVTALFRPVAFTAAIAYPLSRRQHAQVFFRGGLVDGGIILFIVAPCLFTVGHLMGWLVGYGIRFDFMPYFFRALMITLILIPLAHWGRLGLLAATRRKSGNTMLGVIFGVIGFVLAVLVLSVISAGLIGSPEVELAVLAAALLVSQLVYRRKLRNYFRTADLA